MGELYRRITDSFMRLGPVHDALAGGGGASGTFRPTSNARNERMMDELHQFAKHLRRMQAGLMSVQTQVVTQFDGLRNVLVTPLPRVYDLRYDETGELVLATADQMHEVRSIGDGVALDQLERAVSNMKLTMNEEVFRAMRQWEEHFQKAQAHMKMTVRLRDELDAKRRRAEETQKMHERLEQAAAAKREKQARKMAEGAPMGEFGATEADSIGRKLQDRISKASFRVMCKDEGVQGFADLYARQEEVTYKQLMALAKDASALRNIAAEFMLNMRDCFDSAYVAFPAYQPLPYPRSGQALPGTIPASPTPSRSATEHDEYDPLPPQYSTQYKSGTVKYGSNGGAAAPLAPPPHMAAAMLAQHRAAGGPSGGGAYADFDDKSERGDQLHGAADQAAVLHAYKGHGVVAASPRPSPHVPTPPSPSAYNHLAKYPGAQQFGY